MKVAKTSTSGVAPAGNPLSKSDIVKDNLRPYCICSFVEKGNENRFVTEPYKVPYGEDPRDPSHYIACATARDYTEYSYSTYNDEEIPPASAVDFDSQQQKLSTVAAARRMFPLALVKLTLIPLLNSRYEMKAPIPVTIRNGTDTWYI